MAQGTNPRTRVSVEAFAAAAVGPRFTAEGWLRRIAVADDVDPLMNPRPAGKTALRSLEPGLYLDYSSRTTGAHRYTVYTLARIHPTGAIEALAQVPSALRLWRVREAAAIALTDDVVE
jgi:hypothetical protein